MFKVVKHQKNTIMFCGDVYEDGKFLGMNVECGFCKKVFLLKYSSERNDATCVCPHCEKDVLYWEACEW